MGNVIKYLALLSWTRDVTTQDNWTLVFKVATGGLINVYDLYTGSSTLNVDNAAAQSLTSPIAEHFKSDVINNWSTAGITQVRLSVYRDGAEVAFFVFNGTCSDKMSWMSKDKLMNSSYTDMKNAQSTTSTNYFSILGSTGFASTQRVFFINSYMKGCDPDSGWIMVLDTNNQKYCEYEHVSTSTPSILYSPLPTKAIFKDGIPNQESTTQMQSSPNLPNTQTVPISQVQSVPTTVSMQTVPISQVQSVPTTVRTQTVPISQVQSVPTTVPIQTVPISQVQSEPTTVPIQTVPISQVQSEPTTVPTTDQNVSTINATTLFSCIPNQEITIHLETSPNLSNIPTVSSSQLQAEPRTLPRTDQNGGETCMQMCSPPIKLFGNIYCYTPCSVSPTTHTETTHDLNTTPDTKESTSTTQDTSTQISMIDLKEKIRKLNSELKVDKKNTTMYKRSKTSVYEKRTSAVAMGMVGAAVITIVVLLLVIMDCTKCVDCTSKKKNN